MRYSDYEQRELARTAFASEHRTFAEREGYDVIWDGQGWTVHTPRRLRPGEKVQRFQDIAVAWEVAAIRAGRKVASAPRPAPRPHVMEAKRGPGRPRNETK